MTADRKLVALVACGDQLYRRYLLEQLNEAYDVWLLSNEQLSWQRPFICGSTQIPDYTPNSLEKAIVDIQKTREVSGIVCWDERYIIAAADTAVLFELPSAGSLGIRGCRDKALCRTRLSEAGVLQPRSKHCLTLDAAVEFARSLPYPLVVKPRGMGGSIGVALVQDEAALQTRFDEASKASLQGAVDFHYGALIEEFVEGPEISIDACVVDGVYTPLFIAHKSVGLPPHFEEMGHVLCHDDPLLKNPDLLATLKNAHSAIEFENGITHTEVKLTPQGYVIIEINGRLGGDLIPFLATLATGLKPGLIAGQVACGDPVEIEDQPVKRAAAIRFRYPDMDLTVAGVRLPERVTQNGVQGYCVALAAPGTKLGLPPNAHLGRAGYAIAVGEDHDACLALSKKLAQQIEIESRQLERATSGV